MVISDAYLIEELARVGVEVVFLNHTHDHSPGGQLLLQVQGIIAEYERAKIQERNRRGKMHAARTGSVSVMGRAPFGYRYIRRNRDGGDARYEIIPEEAEWVRRIFNWVSLEGYSLADVCRRLDSSGVPTRQRRRGWCTSTVAQMLANSAYIGTAVYGATRTGPRRQDLRRPRRVNEGRTRSPYSIYRTDSSEQVLISVPAIVDAQLFEAAQEQLAANRRRKRLGVVGATVLLQGLMVCARCGYAYHGAYTKVKKKTPYRYYRCGASNPSRVGAGVYVKIVY
jgi:site-specific DNA recombinase